MRAGDLNAPDKKFACHAAAETLGKRRFAAELFLTEAEAGTGLDFKVELPKI